MSPQASQADPWDSLLSCNTMDARSAAITYATLGMKVIRVHGVDAAGHCTCGAYPCGGEANGNAGKHPVDTGWTTAATSDPATVASLFPPDSRWNVGIVPGPSGLSVLDLDVKRANANGVNFFEGSHEHVGGPAAITPSGGAHRIFRHTTACPPSMSKKTLGFDWMTNSGMIVVAPSVTPKGRYRWTAGGPPRPAPAAVIAKLNDAQTIQRDVHYDDATDMPRWSDEDILPGVQLNVTKGERSEAIWGLALALWRAGATGAQVMATLLSTEAGRSKAQDESGPPWLWRYVAWASATEHCGGYDPATDRCAHSFTGFEPVDEVPYVPLGGAFADLADEAQDRPVRLRFIDFSGLESRTIAPPEYVAPGWFPRGLVTGLYGKDGVGKTIWSMAEMIRIAANGGRVLALLAEDTRAAIETRTLEISKELKLPSDRWASRFMIPDLMDEDVKWMHFPRDGRPEQSAFAVGVADLLQSMPFDALLLDPLSDIYEDEENMRNRVAPFMRGLNRQAQQFNLGVLLLGHPAKSDESEYAGSGAWSSKLRSRLFMSKEAVSGVETVLWQHRKASYGPREEDRRYVFTDRGVLRQLSHEAQTTLVGDQMQIAREAVLHAVRELPRRGVATTASRGSPRHIVREMVASGLAQGCGDIDLRNAVATLIADGMLEDSVLFDGRDGRPLVRKPNRTSASGIWFTSKGMEPAAARPAYDF